MRQAVSASLVPRPPWRGARVALGVAGGVAVYKSVQLARDLTRSGATVDVIMTKGAGRFVQPLSFEAVTGKPVHTDLWSGPSESGGLALHLRLGRSAHVVCVAPATADLIARLAHGRADDLLTTAILATSAPVLVCPAMNDRMFAHPQVRANLEHLRTALGYQVVGPASGPLAAGEGEGPGRMVEPDEILEHVGRALGTDPAFRGKAVLVTAGPTQEPLDPVRYVGNHSSGRMGFALARAAWRRGARVLLVTGPSALADPPGVEVVRVETAREMEAAVRARLPEADLAVFAAAVADYRPSDPRPSKLKRAREGDTLSVSLVANPDVAAGTRDARSPDAVVVGFALETEDRIENARKKMSEKGFDLVVVNSPEGDSGFGVDTNRVVLVGPDGEDEVLPLLTKEEVAERVLDRVGPRLRPDRGSGRG
jgi:phosphopantothenoylcysteine decarboxylase/phosphopantothenate--cysteine ligase